MQQCAYVGASLLPEDQPLVTSVPIGPYGVRKQPKKRLSLFESFEQTPCPHEG